jgi:hypothetical protein
LWSYPLPFSSFCFHPTWPTWPYGATIAFCNAFSLPLIDSYYLPYYILVFCLDAFMWDTKNLEIFWSETTGAYKNRDQVEVTTNAPLRATTWKTLHKKRHHAALFMILPGWCCIPLQEVQPFLCIKQDIKPSTIWPFPWVSYFGYGPGSCAH